MAGTNGCRKVLDEVVAYNQARKPKLVRLKLSRMDQDAFAFFRGANDRFAADWHELKPADPGPPVLLCGDLHLENFGAYQTEDGDFLYDVNDFDEAIVAPCGVDLVRCATSILLAAELWKLTPLQAMNMAMSFLDSYRRAVTAAPKVVEGAEAPHVGRGPIWKLLGDTALASQAELLSKKTVMGKGGRRKIVPDELRFPRIRGGRARKIQEAVEAFGAARENPDTYTVLDVSARIAGIGSLGARRYLVLIAGGGTADSNRLLDIKEEFPSALAPCTEGPQPDWGGDEARRVVEAQRALQARPPAGLDVITIGRRTFRIREMIPEENRARISRFQNDPEKLLQAIEVAGELTGWAHRRGERSWRDGRPARDPVVPLAEWAAGPALDALVATAARYAERTRFDYEQFHQALARPRKLPKGLRRFARLKPGLRG